MYCPLPLRGFETFFLAMFPLGLTLGSAHHILFHGGFPNTRKQMASQSFLRNPPWRCILARPPCDCGPCPHPPLEALSDDLGSLPTLKASLWFWISSRLFKIARVVVWPLFLVSCSGCFCCFSSFPWTPFGAPSIGFSLA